MLCFSRKNYFRNHEKMHIFYKTNSNQDGEQVHTHDYIEIVLITDGQTEQVIDGVTYPGSRGSLFFINCGQTHFFTNKTPLSYYNLMLTPEYISEELVDAQHLNEILSLTMFEEFQAAVNLTSDQVPLQGETTAELETLFRGLLREYHSHLPGRQLFMKTYTISILAHIFRRMCTNDEVLVDSELLHYIREHCSEKLTLAGLAQKCFYHPSYLSRMFHRLHGITVTEYITRARLQKAIELLESTPLSVEQICTSCGFGDRTTFFRRFKKHTGCSPLEYRKRENSERRL